MRRSSFFIAAVMSGLSLPVQAADLGARQQGVTPPIWSGVYAGVSAGYATGDDDAAEINGPRNYIADFGGGVGAVHAGWQMQRRGWVAGLELEAGYLGLDSSIERDVTGGQVTSGAELGAYAAFSGRVGYVLPSSLLVYGRAGIVVADIDAATTQTCTGPDLCGGAQSSSVSEAKTENTTWGLLLGAGVEKRLSASWSGRIEYQFMDFRDELALPDVDGPGWDHDIDVHAVKIGLSYNY